MSKPPYNQPSGSTRPKRTTLERRGTQAQRLLQVLIAAYPGPVSLPAILGISPKISQYSARIYELRHRRGYDIRNESVPLPDGTKGTVFRLASLLPDPRIAESPALASAIPQIRDEHKEKHATMPAGPPVSLRGTQQPTPVAAALPAAKASRQASVCAPVHPVTEPISDCLFAADSTWQANQKTAREMRAREQD
jgi:hypothetical protein